jgi:hypothetical protein
VKTDDTKQLTPHQDINDILIRLSEGLKEILDEQLVGLYLTGSLTYGGFEHGSSDIDFLAVLEEQITDGQREHIKKLHAEINNFYPEWAKRTEGSYITRSLLENVEPPKMPRPYVNEGKMSAKDLVYGQEWIMNLYVLYNCGVALVGPGPKQMFKPVSIATMRRASIKSLHENWKPLLKNASILENAHHRAYVILTLCRILHTAKNDGVASKRVASDWVKQAYGKPWSELVKEAENWQHGQDMSSVDEVLDFLRFTLKEVE